MINLSFISIIGMWRPLLEILILWFVIYHILLFFEGTRALQVLKGIIVLLVVFFFSQQLGLVSIDWLLTKLFGISIIAILIIFQPEIRYGLAKLGQRHLFRTMIQEEEEKMLNEVSDAVTVLAEKKIGALIAFAQSNSLKSYVESGVFLDAAVTSELLQSIFSPSGILHDGGIIIQQGRILAAGCLFPLSEKSNLNRTLGTRHRAGLGLSEDSDAVIVIVSEETGNVTIAHKGAFTQCDTKHRLIFELKSILRKKNVETGEN